MRAERIAFLGLLLAFSLVLAYLESLLPFFFGVPGMKLGLPNLAVVLLLYLRRESDGRSAVEALAVNLLRIVLSGFLFGSLFGILFSLCGALCSLGAMLLLKRTGRFGVMGVSMAGGVAHNLGQLFVAVCIVRTAGIWTYAPFLLLAGTLTGAGIGAAAQAALPRLRAVMGRDA